MERVHTFTLQGEQGLRTLSTVGIDFQVADRARFAGELTTVQLGAISIDSLKATPYVAIHTVEHIKDMAVEVVHFGVQRTGRVLLRQDGRRCEVAAGSTWLIRTGAPYGAEHRLTRQSGSRAHCILTSVPITLLPGKLKQITELTAANLPNTPLIAASANFLSIVSLGLPQPGSATASFVEHAIVDLLLAVVAELNAEPFAAESTEAGTRVRIRDFILRRLPDAALDPGRIASEFGISTRYLHRLFESEDTSVGSFIRRERLKKAATDLADPSLRHLELSAIASRSGFAGADQFSRAFKSTYGLAPRDYRKAAGASAPRG